MPREIRFAEKGDAAAIQRIYAPYVKNSAISFETDPPSVREMEKRIEHIGSTYPWLVYETDGRLVGYAYASHHHERPAYRWSVDCTVYVDAGFHGRGIGRELYHALTRLTAVLGYYNAFAGITLPNDRSIRLHRDVGFIHVGTYRNAGFKLGRWHDVSHWQLELNPCLQEPEEPKSIREIEEL